MTVTRCYLYDDDFSAQEARDRVTLGGDRAETVKQIQLIAGLCNASKFESDDPDVKSVFKKISGDATDAAIFGFGMCLSSRCLIKQSHPWEADNISSVTDVQDAWTEIYAQAFNVNCSHRLPGWHTHVSIVKNEVRPQTFVTQGDDWGICRYCRGGHG
jgi:hypothetical protein